MESLKGLGDVIAKEWGDLPGFVKLWTVVMAVFELLFLFVLKSEVTVILNQLFLKQGQIAFLILVILILPLLSLAISGTIISLARKIKKRTGKKAIQPFVNAPPSIHQSLHFPKQIDLDLKSVQVIELVSTTEYSIIEKCLVNGELYILKRTKKELCQVKALQKLVGKDFITNVGLVSIAISTPLALWTPDEYVWELLPYHRGMSLYNLVTRSKYKVQGDLLGKIYNCLIQVSSQLHELGIVHRDITPSNIFLNHNGNLILLDSTFCCQEQSTQVPVANTAYTSPEQIVGKATALSDWYSIAATIYFLANRTPPPLHNTSQFHAGLQNIKTGRYHATWARNNVPNIPNLIAVLLEQDAARRPSRIWEVKLCANTAPLYRFDLTGVLDWGEFGYIFQEDLQHRARFPPN